MTYEPLTFTIPELDGISQASIDEHLGLYQGYVKHVNLISDRLATYATDPDTHGYAMAEIQRRLGFEFGGMRNHEYYFAQLEGGHQPLPDSVLKEKIARQFGSFEDWVKRFKQIALTRGVGWAMLYHDPQTDQLVQTWVDEQHLGQLVDLNIIFGLDMWEHSYMLDYPPSKKKDYIDAYFRNVNWEVVSNRLN